jgi:hypothetical protein
MKWLLVLVFGLMAPIAHAFPTGFVPNVGQLRDSQGQPLPQVDYVLQLPDLQVYLGKGQLHYVLTRPQGAGLQAWRVQLDLPQASPDAYWEADAAHDAPLPFRWLGAGGLQYQVPVHRRLWLRRALPDADICFSLTADGQFKYDLHTTAATAATWHWQVAGATPAVAGELLTLHTPLGDLTEHLPAAWLADGTPLHMRWHLHGPQSVGFAYAQPQPAPTKHVVIDPLLRRWATYMGGNGDEAIQALAFLPDGSFVWGGRTASTNFPVLAGVLADFQGGLYDAVIGRSQANGTLLWSTYYGGPLTEQVHAVAVDTQGRLWVAGQTASPEFVVFDGYDQTYGGNGDGFLLQFAADGTFLRGTFLGDAGDDAVHALSATPDGYLLVVGTSTSASFAAVGHAAVPYGGEGDAWVGKFDLTGRPLWLRWLGGNGYDQGLAVAADSSGTRYYVAGTTQSPDLPGTAGRAQAALSGTHDGFLAALDSAGTLRWASYWGGGDECHATALALDSAGQPHLAGYTFSTDFPLRNAWQLARTGSGSEGWVAQFDTLGQCRWSTYLGGSGFDFVQALAVNPVQRTVYAAGRTASIDFPVADAGFLTTYRGGDWDAFVTELDSSGQLTASLFYGGTADDEALALAANATRVLMCGRTGSNTAFPLLNAWQFFYGGGTADAFCVAWDYSALPTPRAAARPGAVLRVWPQPASQQLWLQLPPAYTSPRPYVLRNTLGQSVRKGTCGPGTSALSLEGVPAGVHWLQVADLPAVRVVVVH